MWALTDQQRAFAEEHHQLIFSFLYTFHLPCEEWYDVAALGYCKAVTRYESEREQAFSTFAYRVMLNDVRQEMRKERAQKRCAPLTSLQREISDGLTLEDTLGYEQRFMEDEPPTAAHTFIRSMSMEQRFIIVLLAAGATHGEIAKKMGVARGQVTKQVKEIRERFEDAFPCRKEAAHGLSVRLHA